MHRADGHVQHMSGGMLGGGSQLHTCASLTQSRSAHETAPREHSQVEDLLEYYLQRASATQSEAERLLEGARDLEESIGVSLSARR
jgi:hypothetical protein